MLVIPDNYYELNYNVLKLLQRFLIGTFSLFLSASIVSLVLPNNFIVSFDNNSNLYPVFTLNNILLLILLA